MFSCCFQGFLPPHCSAWAEGSNREPSTGAGLRWGGQGGGWTHLISLPTFTCWKNGPKFCHGFGTGSSAGLALGVAQAPFTLVPTDGRDGHRGAAWGARGGRLLLLVVVVVADGTSRARRRAGATACGTTCPSTSASSKPAAATTARATSGPSTPPTWTTSPRATTTAGGRAGASAGEPGWFGEGGGGSRGCPGGFWGSAG